MTLEELLAVLEAGAGVGLAPLQRACDLAVEASGRAGEAWVRQACAALLALADGGAFALDAGGGIAASLTVGVAFGALFRLRGLAGAEEAARGGVWGIVGAAWKTGKVLEAEMARLQNEFLRLKAHVCKVPPPPKPARVVPVVQRPVPAPVSGAPMGTVLNVMVRTLAGSGEKGAADGSGSAARFYFPQGVCVATTRSGVLREQSEILC